MNSIELLPILSGLVLGSLLSAIRPAFRTYVGVASVFLLGCLISAAAGELRISWSYSLVDTVLVMISALAGYVAARYLRFKLSGPGLSQYN